MERKIIVKVDQERKYKQFSNLSNLIRKYNLMLSLPNFYQQIKGQAQKMFQMPSTLIYSISYYTFKGTNKLLYVKLQITQFYLFLSISSATSMLMAKYLNQHNNINRTQDMRPNYTHQNIPVPPNQHHVHYHYHYHYPNSETQQENPQVHYPSKFSSQRVKKTARSPSPDTYASSIEMNQWKKYLNPEVSKMYDQFNIKKSRFSEKYNRISEEDSIVEVISPRKESNMRDTRLEILESRRNQLSKLEELYYSQKGVKLKDNYECSEFTKVSESKLTASFDPEQIRDYQRELNRLKMYEEECLYLRNNYMNHIQRRHPEEYR